MKKTLLIDSFVAPCSFSTSKTERRAGFSILEVMISVAILGLCLTAIFSSEVSATKAAHRSRVLTQATMLARCKMGEVEENISKEGLPAISDEGRDNCCEGAEVEGFRCNWKVTRIQLPDVGSLIEEDGAGGAELENAASEDPDTAMTDPQGAVDDMLSGGGGDAIAGLAMQYVYPLLKPAVEEQVRRIEVEVNWEEGKATRGFSVVQFLVAEGAALPSALIQDAAAGQSNSSNQNTGASQGSNPVSGSSQRGTP